MNWNFNLTSTPSRTQLNNAQVNYKGGMPLKESTTTNENRFSMLRHTYVHTNNTATAGKSATKKWYPNQNRDASAIMREQKAHTVGNTSLNPSGSTMAFTAYNRNTNKQALQRVRNKGAVIPPKVVQNRNAPMFF